MRYSSKSQVIPTFPGPICVALIALVFVCADSSAAEVRTWTPTKAASAEPFEAEFLKIDRDQVVLQLVEGNRRVSVPGKKLSKGDIAWLKDRAATRSTPLTAKQIAAMVQIPDKADGVIHLPLRVYLINGVVLNKDGITMRTWVTPKEIEENILPEINRIWEPAGIQWTLESVIDMPVADLPDRDERMAYVEKSARLPNGQRDKKRTDSIRALSGKDARHPAMNNLYLFPYVGSTYQGFAAMSGNVAHVCTWTNKPSGGKKPPQQFSLVEDRPFKIGSIARTTSHELGHNLGLSHPDKKAQTQFGRLMGGKKHGYSLIPAEIELAREKALIRAKAVRSWASRSAAGLDDDLHQHLLQGPVMCDDCEK